MLILKVLLLNCTNSLAEGFKLDWNSSFQTLFSGSTFFLEGVIFVLGLMLVTNVRRNARFGFYINLQIFIRRFRFFIDNYPNLTAYLVKDDIRKEKNIPCLPFDQAKFVMPFYVSLCEDFLRFIEQAENNVVPKHRKKDNVSKEDEWNKWYTNILTLVDYAQKCQFINLEKSIFIYYTKENSAQYYADFNDFKNAVTNLCNQLEITLKYK